LHSIPYVPLDAVQFHRRQKRSIRKVSEPFRLAGGVTSFGLSGDGSRFIAVLRTWAAVIAGAACMSFATFVTYNTIGSIVWAIAFGLLGYYFGRDLPLLEHYISHASLALLVILAIGIVALVVIKRKRAASTEAP
jgi:membrane-associated protein